MCFKPTDCGLKKMIYIISTRFNNRDYIMARQKRISKVIDKAQHRAAGLASISPDLDLGNSLGLATYKAMITETRNKLEAYNNALSVADAANNALKQSEKELAMTTERMLVGVAFKYGKDSSEYEMAGGVRKSERKRPVRKLKTTTS
jgi:hypothetical protein